MINHVIVLTVLWELISEEHDTILSAQGTTTLMFMQS